MHRTVESLRCSYEGPTQTLTPSLVSSVLTLTKFCFGTDLWITLLITCGKAVDNLDRGRGCVVWLTGGAFQTQKRVKLDLK